MKGCDAGGYRRARKYMRERMASPEQTRALFGGPRCVARRFHPANGWGSNVRFFLSEENNAICL